MTAIPQSVFAETPNDRKTAVNIAGGKVRLIAGKIYYDQTAGSFHNTKFVLNGTVVTGDHPQYYLTIASSQADLSDTDKLLKGYGSAFLFWAATTYQAPYTRPG